MSEVKENMSSLAQDAPCVRSLCKIWAEKTLGEWIDESALEDAGRVHRILDIVCRDRSNLGKKDASGWITQGLIRSNEAERFSPGFTFSEIFRVNLHLGEKLLGRYLIDLMGKLSEHQESLGIEFAAAFVARGLRAFPSFLREVDFSVLLQQALTMSDSRATVKRGSLSDDVEGHADLKLRFRGHRYGLWHYQASDRGLSSLTRKLRDLSDGKLPRGLHVFCPVDLESVEDCDDHCGWRLCSFSYAERIVDELECGASVPFQRIRQDLHRPGLFAEPFVMRKGWFG